MPYLPLPDGSYLKALDNETPEQAWARAQKLYPQIFADPSKAQTGGIANLKAGLQDYLGNLGVAGSLLDGPEAARERARLEQAKQIEAAKATEWQDVKQAYDTEGLGAGIGALGAFARDSIARSLPQMGATVAGAKLGAVAGSPLGPAGSVVGGVAGAVLPNIAAFTGSNVGRQVAEQDATGKQAPIDVGAAVGSAAVQGSLDAAATMLTLGFKNVGSILKKPLAEVEQEILKRAQASLAATVAKGVGRGVAAEMPTEVAQQVLERAQAGLSLTDADARAEYEAAAAGAAVVGGPLGAAGNVRSRSQARDQAKKIEAAQAAAAREQADREEAERKEAPDYLLQLDDQFNAFKGQLQELNAQIKAIGKPAADDYAAQADLKELKEKQKQIIEQMAPVKEEWIAARKDIQALKKQNEPKKSPMEVFAEQYGIDMTPTDGKEEDLIPGLRQPKPPMAPEQAEVNKIVDGLKYWADQQGQPVPPEGIAEILARRPDLGLAILEGKAVIPGVTPEDRKVIHGLLRQANPQRAPMDLFGKAEREMMGRAERQELDQQADDDALRQLAAQSKAEQEAPAPIEPATNADIAAYRKGELQPEAPTVAQEDFVPVPETPDPAEKAIDTALPDPIGKDELKVEEQDVANKRKKLLRQLNEELDELLVFRDPATKGTHKMRQMQIDRIAKELGQNVLDQINSSRELNGYSPMGWEGAADVARKVEQDVKRMAYASRGDKAPGSADAVKAQRIQEMMDQLNRRKESMQTDAVGGRNRAMRGSKDLDRIDRQLARLRDMALMSQKEQNIGEYLQRIIDDGVFAGQRVGTPTGSPQAAKTPFRLREDNSMFDARRAKDAPKSELEEEIRRINAANVSPMQKRRMLEQLRSRRDLEQRRQGDQARRDVEDPQGELALVRKGEKGRYESIKLSQPLSKRPPEQPKPAEPEVDPKKKELEDAKYDLQAVKDRKASVLSLHSDVIAAQAEEKQAWRNVEGKRKKLEQIKEGKGQAYKEARAKLDEVLQEMDLLSKQEETLRASLIKLTDPAKRAGLAKAADRIKAKADIQEIVVRRARVALNESLGSWPFEINNAIGELINAEKDFESSFARMNELGAKLAEARKNVPDNEPALQARYERLRDIFERRDVGDARRLLEQAEKDRKSAEKMLAEQKKLEENEATVRAARTAKELDERADALEKSSAFYGAAKQSMQELAEERRLSKAANSKVAGVRRVAARSAQRMGERLTDLDRRAAAAERRAAELRDMAASAEAAGDKVGRRVSGQRYTGEDYATAEALKEEALRLAASRAKRGAAQQGKSVDDFLEAMPPEQWEKMVATARKKVMDDVAEARAAGRKISDDPSNWSKRWGNAVQEVSKDELEEMIRRGEVPSLDEQSKAAIFRIMTLQAQRTDINPHTTYKVGLKTGSPESRGKATRQQEKNRKILAERFRRQKQLEREVLGDADDVSYASDTERQQYEEAVKRIAAARKRAGTKDKTDRYHKKTFAEVARDLEKRVTGPDRKELAARIASIMEKANFKGEVLVDPGLGGGGFYIEKEGVIMLSGDDIHTALHELSHAATVAGIRSNAKLASEINASMDVAQEYLKTKEGKAAFRKLFPMSRASMPYGMKDPLEFIAESLSNRQFQRFLANIPTNKPKHSLWNRLVEAIANFLGLSRKNWTALNDALWLAERSMQETAAILELDGRPDPGRSVQFHKPSFDNSMKEYKALHDALLGKEDKNWLQGFRDGLLNLRTKYLDHLAPIQAVADDHQGRLDDAVQAGNMMYATRMADQKAAFVAEVVSEGALKLKRDKDGRILVEATEGSSLKNLVKFIGEQKEGGDTAAKIAAYDMYRKAKRAGRVGWDALGADIPNELRALGKKLVDNPLPWFKEADRIYNEFNKGLIDFAVETGALSHALGRELSATNDYVPYYREDKGELLMELDSGAVVSIGNIKDQPYLKELAGRAKAQTLPLVEGALQNASMLTDLAMRNLATRNTAFALKKFGLGEFVKPTMKGDNIIRFRVDGEDKAFRVDSDKAGVPSELLVKGMEGVAVAIPDVVRMMGIPAKLLRRMVTRNPVYIARQLARDSLMVSVAGGANITPIASSVKEFAKAMGGKHDKALQHRGVVGGNVFSHDIFDNERLLKEVASGKTGWATAMAKLDAWSMQADAATRRAAYNSYLDQGLSEQEATMAALETMNFSRHGTSASLRLLGAMIPFMNAQIQGLDALYRAFRGKMPMENKLNIKRKLLQRGMMMASLSFMYALGMQDDEAYKNASLEDRLNNWFVRIPGVDDPIKIPIPFELGYIFKAIPEALAMHLTNQTDGPETVRALGSLAWMSVPNVVLPQGIKPALEVFFNKSLFNWADIETEADQRVDKTERYNERTSEIAKSLSFSIEAGGREIGLSPKQIEYLVRGYTAGLGTALFKAADLFLPTEAPAPEKLATELPIIGTTMQPTDSLGRVNALYAELQKYERSEATLKKLIEEGKDGEAEKYLERNEENVGRAGIARQARKQIAAFKDQEKQIRLDKELTPQQKRAEIDALRKEQIEFMRDVREALRQ